MKKVKYFVVLASTILIGIMTSCNASDDYVVIPISPVSADLTLVPYQKLSEYHFFEGDLKNMTPSYGVIPYKPISELFTDYALKKRFIWLPNGVKASYNGDGNILNLPIGAVLIKSFYYDNVQPGNTTRIVETRLMIRKSTEWIFAEYVWNAEQTEAFLQTQSSQTAISWIDGNNNLNSINYKIPSVTTDCKRCHASILGDKFPIGIKPQNLNSFYNYAESSKNQLSKLIEIGYLENNLPSSIETVVDYNDIGKPLNLRIRSYFDANCAHCHVDGGEADAFDLRFAFNQTIDPAEMGVGVQAQHFVPGFNGRIVQPNNVNQSILHYRVNTQTDSYYMMPPLGRTIRHAEGVHLIEQWINSF